MRPRLHSQSQHFKDRRRVSLQLHRFWLQEFGAGHRPGSFRMRRSLEKEMMDLPDQPKQLLEEDLRNLTIINRYLGGYRGVMRAVARLVEEQKLARFSLLDVVAGSGDIPARIATRIRKKRSAARLVAIHTAPVTVAVMAEKSRDTPEISLLP